MYSLKGIKDSGMFEDTNEIIDPGFDYCDNEPWDSIFTAKRAHWISKRQQNKLQMFVDNWLFQIKKKAAKGEFKCSFKYFYKGSYCYQKRSLDKLIELGYKVSSKKEDDGIRIIVEW
jgi:hypothetical protein